MLQKSLYFPPKSIQKSLTDLLLIIFLIFGQQIRIPLCTHLIVAKTISDDSSITYKDNNHILSDFMNREPSNFVSDDIWYGVYDIQLLHPFWNFFAQPK